MKWLDKKGMFISIREKPAALIILLFTLIIGIAAGATAYNQLQQFVKVDYIGGAVKSIGAHAGFHFYGIVQTICVNIACFILASLSGLWVPGMPFSLISVLVKGFFIGTATTALLNSGGAFGVLGAILVVAIPGAPAAIALLLSAYMGLREWAPRSKAVLQGGHSGTISRPYLVQTLNLFKLFLIAIALDIVLSSLLFSLCVALFG
ncbi:MAG: hypothetical protein AAGU74_03525 [Bacillota bacterium]